MLINLKNISSSRSVTLLERKTGKLITLNPGDSKNLIIESEEELKDYKRSYEAFGIEFIEKTAEDLLKEAPKEEAPVEAKPKRRRSSKAKTEEAPKEEAPAETVAEANHLEEVKVEDVVEEAKEL